MTIVPALAILALLTVQPAAAQTSVASWCRSHPERVEACRQIRGRITAHNGTPTFRIWVVGTNRIVAPVARDYEELEEGRMLPQEIRAALGNRPLRTQVFADFEICPVERQQPGWMQHVCVARATRLRAVRF